MATPKKPKDPHNFKEIGDYFVKDPLGEGVNGAVRLGVQKETGMKVALKFITKMELTDKQAERLKREIRFLTLLHHPHIVKLHDVFETPQYYVLAMDRIRKGELLKFITDNGYIQENKFRIIFRQMLSAVNYCHENSVVHRDLKPENILMDDNKNIKIIDFGLSNIFDGQNLLNTFCGSPKYAAPEIITGTKYVGPSVDLWSLGVILFAGLTGKLPFNGRTVESTYAKVLAGIVKYPPHLSPLVKDYISKFLILDCNERITMKEALVHPWIVEGMSAVETYLLPRPEVVSDPQPDVFSQLLEYGYTEKEARTALNDSAPGPIKNTYHLLLEKKGRELKNASETVSRERFSFSNLLKHSLRSKKNKFDKDGFLLDISYISPQIIRMSNPADTVDSIFSNPVKEVLRFFEKYHKDHFRIFNLCPNDYNSYSPEKFNNCVSRFPVPDEVVPTIQTLYAMNVEMDEYLNKSPENVVAIHGKQDLIRPALAICSYLLHSHAFDTVDEVISFFTEKLYPVEEKVPKNLFTPSMRRYLDYYQHYCKHSFTHPREKLYCINTIELNAIPNFDVYGGCDPFAKIKLNGTVMVNVKKTVPLRHFSEKKDTSIIISCDTVPMSGDIYLAVLDRDPLYAETMFSLCINLAYLEQFHNFIPLEPETELDDDVINESGFVVITATETPKQSSSSSPITNRFAIVFTKKELDIDKKDEERFPEDFAITVTFTEPKALGEEEPTFFRQRRLSSISSL